MNEAEGTRRAFRISIRFALSVIIVVSLALIITAVAESEDSDARTIIKGDYYYEVVSEKEYLVNLSKISTDKGGTVSVPAYIEDGDHRFAVIGIDDKACMNRKSITGLSVPSTVTSIGEYAFYGCVKLNKVSGLTNVSKIGQYAFADCRLINSINLFSDVEVIEPYTFYNCSAMEDFTTVSPLTRIEEHAFDGCGSLTEFKLSSKIEKIGDYAFHGCSRITYAYLPNTVTYLGIGAYSGCSSLGYVVIPNNIIELKGYLFMDCTSLAIVMMSDDVEMIGPNTFYNCINISTITISSKVEFIGSFAFYGIDFYNFEETQKITDDTDLPGYTYVLKEPGVMIRQETYAVHYNPNGGPNLADDEPHIAGQYFIPTRIESGVLVCEDWIYNGRSYHYGEKILMPGEDITLDCVWTQMESTNKEEDDTEKNGSGPTATIIAVMVGVLAIASVVAGAYFLKKKYQQ